ncbi:MAG TPA: hypothetical protein VLD58_15325 [Gemmatimonadales bacterium]|nr:hypothetical protein [Gemmatimonadales bacterium]
MDVISTTLPLSGFGTPRTEAKLEIGSLSAGERFRRAVIAPVAGLFVSIAVLPIPIVHFAVPPVAILTGIVLGIRRIGQRRIITRAEGVCPFCGTSQTLGLNGTSYRMPRELKCRSCLKPFTISAD